MAADPASRDALRRTNQDDDALSPGEIALLTERDTLTRPDAPETGASSLRDAQEGDPTIGRPGGGLGVVVAARFEVRDGWLKRWWAKMRGRA
jgi:hypothetical protein